MQFEYVKIRYGEEQKVLVCDRDMLPATLNCLANETVDEVVVEARLRLSRSTSAFFTSLANIDPIFDRSLEPDADGKYPTIFPVIRFPLDAVRYAISTLVFDEAERLGRALRAQGHKWNQDGPDAHPCPPVDVDDAVDWIIQTERLIRHKHADGVELRGTPDDMHATLTAILQDNINHQLYALQHTDITEEDDDSELM